MEDLYLLHKNLINSVKCNYIRNVSSKIDWEERCIAITGARGVGKTTCMMHHIKENFGSSTKALYISADHIKVQKYTLYDIAEHHNNYGGTHLFIDEIHKNPDWSLNVKSIYDTFPDLHVVISGSSILQLNKSKEDLSRRMVNYVMNGFSFREYLEFKFSISLEAYTLKSLLTNHEVITPHINTLFNPLVEFENYLKYGYYPYGFNQKNAYFDKLQNTINTVMEVDIPIVSGMDVQNIRKIKKLLGLIATSVPFQPNITKLAGSLELNRTTLYMYLEYLERACLISSISNINKGYSGFAKPDKLFLNNTNISHSFFTPTIDKGTERETFFLNQLRSAGHQVTLPQQGDFLIDEKYTFEVGGSSKTFHKIANLKNSYVAADEIKEGLKKKIPLWLFGFLY